MFMVASSEDMSKEGMSMVASSEGISKEGMSMIALSEGIFGVSIVGSGRDGVCGRVEVS